MKNTGLIKGFLTLIGVILVLFSGRLWADQVNSERALAAARTHVVSLRGVWSQIPELEGIQVMVKDLHPLTDGETDKTLGYVVDLEPQGFVVLSASTDISPVIAYSFRCDFSWEEDRENVLLWMVRQDLALRIQAIERQVTTQNHRNAPSWQDYLDEKNLALETEQWPAEGSTSTGGWVETTWHQQWPYNTYCPKDPETGTRCVVGCVATAMSQIIDYYADRDNYFPPVRLEGWNRYTSYGTSPPIRIDRDSTLYDFPSISVLNQYVPDVQVCYALDDKLMDHELGTLSFICGISVEMHYSSSGSGSAVWDVPGALKTIFNYSSAEWVQAGSSMYDKLRENMKDGLPAELSIISDESGHAIVCDGLRLEGENEYYHLNFGWGKNSPEPISNAWYLLPWGMPAGFSFVTGAALNIRPPTVSSVVEEQKPDSLSHLEIILNPNPIRSGNQVTFEFTLTTPSHVEITVFDASGSKLKKLVDSHLTDGHHCFTLSLHDDNGSVLASGSYFILMHTDKEVSKTKLIVLE
ncbi:C10 family peptidase [candidate division WOR-3 bacterium]|nr:C10 family peptidase [candidate division WOR-3 bacterium]